MHASDRAHLLRLAAEPVEPGSLEEAEALALIDENRAKGDPCLACAGHGCAGCAYSGFKQRPNARRSRRHWSKRSAQLGRTW